MNRAHVLPLALSLALSACTSYDLGITQVGAQDLGLARDHIASGQIPDPLNGTDRDERMDIRDGVV